MDNVLWVVCVLSCCFLKLKDIFRDSVSDPVTCGTGIAFAFAEGFFAKLMILQDRWTDSLSVVNISTVTAGRHLQCYNEAYKKSIGRSVSHSVSIFDNTVCL